MADIGELARAVGVEDLLYESRAIGERERAIGNLRGFRGGRRRV
jgi:hypothetical protein